MLICWQQGWTIDKERGVTWHVGEELGSVSMECGGGSSGSNLGPGTIYKTCPWKVTNVLKPTPANGCIGPRRLMDDRAGY